MADDFEELIPFVQLFTQAGRLKRLRRQGWVDRGVESPESVSDHSFRLALMTLVVASSDPEIDAGRAVRLALVHDLPEALAGDVTPFDEMLADPRIDREALFQQAPEYSDRADSVKTAAERAALDEMTAELPEHLRAMLVAAWEEYETGESPESKLVRQLDKLETWLQALEYHRDQSDLVIESFRRGTERDIDSTQLLRLKRAIDDAFGSS